jgi:hypothetical protein
MGEDDVVRVKTASGVVLTLARMPTRRRAVLTFAYGPHLSNLILDADDVAALADAFAVLAEALAVPE